MTTFIIATLMIYLDKTESEDANFQKDFFQPVLAKYRYEQYGPLNMNIYELCSYYPYYFIGHKTLSSNKTYRLLLQNIPNIKQN
ncbi:hypothetical protein C2G38_2185085 [Gigaspora rosea]|uniref:Uncharacterized protein n=1 Tax=Gigaspora rosea TaxID=44941 RepID=A0A397VBE4_9GLOM|nr:hypothetical protein C2G38_2185085 [Gigaspora rosea]